MTTPNIPTSPAVALRGASRAADPAAAAAELSSRIGGQPAALRVVFCSPAYDPDILAPALFGEFADAPLIGCTTAGEIGPDGYLESGLSGFSLPAGDFQVAVGALENIADFELAHGPALVEELLAELERTSGSAPMTQDTFAMLLVDGLSVREEAIVSSLHGALGGIQLFGGSAGDRLDFGQTRLLRDGRLVSGCAVLALVRTTRPFRVFKTQHFVPMGRKLVVTGADVERRVVTEINGGPAAEEYALAVGVEVAELTPDTFSTHPVVVRVGGQDYVRAIYKAEPDGSLTFFCAIDEGVVLTLAHGENMADDLERLAGELEEELGELELTIGCDCILRHLEVQQRGLAPRVDALLSRLRMAGFATYGEQIRAMHVNQTLTGVAIARGRRA